MDNKDYLRVMMYCKEIIDKMENFNSEEDCIEDLQGDVEADISEIMFYVHKLIDYKVIGSLVYEGNKE